MFDAPTMAAVFSAGALGFGYIRNRGVASDEDTKIAASSAAVTVHIVGSKRTRTKRNGATVAAALTSRLARRLLLLARAGASCNMLPKAEPPHSINHRICSDGLDSTR